MCIRAFFNMIYGDYLYENGQTFLSNYAEKSGSTAIIEQPREIPVPNYFSDFSKHKVKSEENLDESIIKAFNTVQHTSYNLDYDCEVYMLNMKSDCHVNAVCKSFFLSPTKICILNKFPNTGTKYSEFFTPMTISILEQIVDFESQTISVKQTFMVGVKFHKPILFFQGKIKSLVMDKLKDNIEKIMIPMIKESIS